MLSMDEDAFRLFYERTSRPVWLYLMKMTGDSSAADDLLQDIVLPVPADPSGLRERRASPELPVQDCDESCPGRPAPGLVEAQRVARRGGRRASCWSTSRHALSSRADLARAMSRLRPRERALLWLAYAQGSSHDEIAGSLGLRKVERQAAPVPGAEAPGGSAGKVMMGLISNPTECRREAEVVSAVHAGELAARRRVGACRARCELPGLQARWRRSRALSTLSGEAPTAWCRCRRRPGCIGGHRCAPGWRPPRPPHSR